MSRAATGQLVAAGVPTLAALGRLEPARTIPDLSGRTLERVREQARIQLEGRELGRPPDDPLWERIAPRPDETRQGLALLPEPSPRDLFFDIEADPWLEEHGREYLLGTLSVDGGATVYRPFWGHSVEEERTAFEGFIDDVMARLERDPRMHVYHYGGYESGAIKRLMQRHATREDEVDRILRGGVLVDLLSVVRQGIRASVESYSLKQVEHLFGFDRQGRVTQAGFSVVEYEEWLGTATRLISRRWRTTTAMTAWPRSACATGSRTAGGAGTHSGPSTAADRGGAAARRRSPAQRRPAPSRRADRRAHRRPGRGDDDERRAGSSRRCSTGTGARRARPGGTTSACASSRSTTSSPSRSRSAGSSFERRRRAKAVATSSGSPSRRRTTRSAAGADRWQDDGGRGVTIVDVDDEHGELVIARGQEARALLRRALLRRRPFDAKVPRDLGRFADEVIEGGLDGRDPIARSATCCSAGRRGCGRWPAKPGPTPRGRPDAAPGWSSALPDAERPGDPGSARHRQDLHRTPG